MAAGDVLEVEARLETGTHAVVTTPGATRFYRSEGALAEQRKLGKAGQRRRQNRRWPDLG